MDKTRRYLMLAIAVNITAATSLGWPLACKLLTGANALVLLGCIGRDVVESR